jgi:predicted nucleic acid-binding protein
MAPAIAATQLALVKTWIIDTGPLVAYLDARDPAHGTVSRALDAFPGQLVTTSAVITETMHFVSAHRGGAALLAEFVADSGLTVFDFSKPQDLRAATLRMEKYADTPMDYADATLLLLAEHIVVFEILTLDRRGFTVFRTQDGRSLVRVLDV